MTNTLEERFDKEFKNHGFLSASRLQHLAFIQDELERQKKEIPKGCTECSTTLWGKVITYCRDCKKDNQLKK